MLTPAMLATLEANAEEFRTTYTTSSFHHLPAVVAHVGTVATAPTSAESRHALKIYHAALDDLDTPAADIAFLRGVYETERQTDFDRANPVAYAARTGTPYRDLSDED